jgi:hypothetical protein
MTPLDRALRVSAELVGLVVVVPAIDKRPATWTMEQTLAATFAAAARDIDEV